MLLKISILAFLKTHACNGIFFIIYQNTAIKNLNVARKNRNKQKRKTSCGDKQNRLGKRRRFFWEINTLGLPNIQLGQKQTHLVQKLKLLRLHSLLLADRIICSQALDFKYIAHTRGPWGQWSEFV